MTLFYCTWAPTSLKGGIGLMDLYVMGNLGLYFKEIHTHTHTEWLPERSPTIIEGDETEHTHTQHAARTRKNHLLQESRYSNLRNIRIPIVQQSNVSHPELSDPFSTESLAAKLSTTFSTLDMYNTEVLACRLIGTCGERPQTTEYLTACRSLRGAPEIG